MSQDVQIVSENVLEEERNGIVSNGVHKHIEEQIKDTKNKNTYQKQEKINT